MLNKSNMISEIADRTNQSKAATERFVEAFQDVIIETVANGEDVRLTGFLAFSPKSLSARTMTNPKTGKQIDVPEKKSVKVRPLKRFKDTVNGCS